MQNIQIKYQKADSSYEELFPVMLGTIPIGGIIMWSGAQDNIPQYWVLCDGTNGTPDLRNRFIVGAGSGYAVGNTGGSKSVALTTAEIPQHRHTMSGTVKNSSDIKIKLTYVNSWGNETAISPYGTTDFSSSGNGATYGFQSKSSAQEPSGLYLPANSLSASFSGNTGYSGSSGAHENRPPYYALCFIMRIQ